MLRQKGGYADLGFYKKDLHNHLDSKRRISVHDGDAYAALSYLLAKVDSDPLFLGIYSMTNYDKLKNLFLCDGDSRVDFDCFGDVVAFDSTYKRNKCNKPLVNFSGTNHHGKTCIFG